MNNLKLEKVNEKYIDQIMEYKNEFIAINDHLDGTQGLTHYTDIYEWLNHVKLLEKKETLPPCKVVSTLYLSFDQDELIGMIDIRHYLNHNLEMYGGHIGYSIRPSKRRLGYGTKQLELALLKCKELNIEVRVLQIESDYSDEICEYDFPNAKLIGYEVCEIPFDSQIITDFDWYGPLHKFYIHLNQYGLFNSIEQALKFKEAYEYEYEKGAIGDGEMDIFICKVSEVDVESFIRNYSS